MSVDEPFDFTDFSDLAVDVTKFCNGLDLIAADSEFDNCRRFIWYQQFSGVDPRLLLRQLDKHPRAREIVEMIGHISPLDAEKLFFEARCLLWLTAFARRPNSKIIELYEVLFEKKDGRPI